MKRKSVGTLTLLSVVCWAIVLICTSCVNVINEGYEIPIIEIPEEPEMAIGYSGEDLTGIVEITRNVSTKQASFTITENCEWQLYAGPSLDLISLKEPITTGTAAGTFVLDVPISHCYFQVVTPKGSAILSERRTPISEAKNFRDMGGYKTTDGRYVKWGMLYRSNALSSLTAADRTYISTIPVVSIVDFRGPGEGSYTPPAPATYYNYPLAVINYPPLENFYATMLSNSVNIGFFKQMFELLQNDKAPLLIHCSAGRDRTGIGAALILLALGVDKEIVIDDYMLTNLYVTEYGNIERSWLGSTINSISSYHGSPDQFFKVQMGIEDIEAFRAKYLLGEKR